MLLSVTGLYHLYGNKTVLILGSGLKAITISCFADFVKVPYPSIHHPLSVTLLVKPCCTDLSRPQTLFVHLYATFRQSRRFVLGDNGFSFFTPSQPQARLPSSSHHGVGSCLLDSPAFPMLYICTATQHCRVLSAKPL